jgi:cold shock CspA family protein
MDKTRSLANPEGQYRTWMEEAGFATITRSDPEGDVLVASKLG